MSPSRTVVLTRDSIKNGFIDRMIAERGGLADRWSEEQIVACYRDMLAKAPPGDVWVFGYGSLIWNPAINIVERRRARLRGFHRRFCLWTHLGRGSSECPGLVLGLEPGGECTGAALRVERGLAEAEFDILFRREMISGSYDPRWVTVRLEGSDERVQALCFVMNRAHARYAKRLTDAQVVDAVARARGALGPCSDYLEQTVTALAAMGIRDRNLTRLQKLVQARLDAG